MCRVQAHVPYVMAGAFVALPPVSAQLATQGNRETPPARSPVTRHAQDLVRWWVRDWTAVAVVR